MYVANYRKLSLRYSKDYVASCSVLGLLHGEGISMAPNLPAINPFHEQAVNGLDKGFSSLSETGLYMESIS